jgi:GntR family transcriptional regulator
MLDIDRDASRSVRDQLVEQLRYQIARGHFRVNDTLPSTRALGEQLGLSFHTVRKAYRVLVDEGLLESHAGRGYTVKERTPFSKSERMERGADAMHDALQRLIGLGLSDGEINALVQEQLALLDHAGTPRKLLMAGPCAELNELCARQISSSLQQPVRAVRLSDLSAHADADFVFTPYPMLSQAMQAVPRADTLGIGTHLPAAVLERVARCTDHDSVGLLTQAPETIGPLSKQLRDQTAFAGQVIAASLDQRAEHMDSFVDQLDLLLFTPLVRRRVRARLSDGAPPCMEIAPVVSKDALSALQQAVPS